MHDHRSRYSTSRLGRKLLSVLQGRGFNVKILGSEEDSCILLKSATASWIKKLSDLSQVSNEKFSQNLAFITKKLIKRVSERKGLRYVDVELERPILSQSQITMIQLILNLIYLGVLKVQRLLEDQRLKYVSPDSTSHLFNEISRIKIEDDLPGYLESLTKKYFFENSKTLEHLAIDGIITNIAIAVVLYSSIQRILQSRGIDPKKVRIYIEPRISRSLSRDHWKQLLDLGLNVVEVERLSIVRHYNNKRYIEVIADLAVIVKQKTKVKKERFVLKALIEVKRYRNTNKLLEFLRIQDYSQLSRDNKRVLESIVKNLLSLIFMDIVVDYIVIIYTTSALSTNKILELESKFKEFLTAYLGIRLRSLIKREEYVKSLLQVSKKMLSVKVVSVKTNRTDIKNIKRVAHVIHL